MTQAKPSARSSANGADPNAALAERLTELEIKLCFAEDWVETLNRLVTEQQNQIERLQRDMGFLRQQGEGPSGPQVRDPRDELPPHY